MSSPAASPRRLAFGTLALTAALLGGAAPSASAADVSLKTSTRWAVIGFPVTVTITSSVSGTVYLSQVRRDAMTATGPYPCPHDEDAIVTRDVTGRPVTAGKPVKFTLQPSTLAYFGGDLLPPAQVGCWDKATPFDRLSATLATEDGDTGTAVRSFSRVL